MPNTYQVLSESDQIWQKALALQIAEETRLPIPRVLMLEWSQVSGNRIQTRSREAELQPLTAAALNRLPCNGRFVFSSSPFPPIVPDEYLEGAKRWCKKHSRRGFLSD